MNYYIFYDKDLNIMANSTQPDALEYPYIVTQEPIIDTRDIALERQGDKIVIRVKEENIIL